METSSLLSSLPPIQVPDPCHENWDQMSPTEKGSFCQKCKKEVRDFTHSSLSEILAASQDKEEVLCGRFRRDQLAPDRIILLNPTQSPNVWKRWAVAALALLGLHTASAQVSDVPADTFKTVGTTEQGFLTGVVRGRKFQKPLEGASVVLLNENGIITGTYTDGDGSFRLQVPKGIKGSPLLSIRIQYMGGLYFIGNPDLSAHFEVKLNEMIWMEEVVIEGEEPYGSVTMGSPMHSPGRIGRTRVRLTYQQASLYGYEDLNEFIFMRMGQGVSERY